MVTNIGLSRCESSKVADCNFVLAEMSFSSDELGVADVRTASPITRRKSIK